MNLRFIPIVLGLVVLVASAACSLLGGVTPTPFAIETVIPTAAPIVTQPPASPTATVPSVSATATPSPTVSAATVVVPAPTRAPLSFTPVPTRIAFPPGGTSVTVSGTLTHGGIARYRLRALRGQTMSLNLLASQGQAVLVVFGADGTVLLSDHAGATQWSGTLPSTQDYMIDVKAGAAANATYTLQITIPPLGQVSPPQDTPRRITFAPGATSATIQGTTATPGADGFVVRALVGQTMTVNVASASGNVIVIIYGADGSVLISDHAGATHWTGQIPTTQDYMIDTRSVRNAQVPFTLSVTIQ